MLASPLLRPIVLLVLTAGTANAQSLGTWFTRAPMPTARQEIAHAVVDGKVYVPCGLLSMGASRVVEVFDPATNTWSTIPQHPLPLHHYPLAVVNGRLFTLAGYNQIFVTTDRVFEFDFPMNAWIERAPMPGGRGASVAAVHNDLIYVVGGVNASGAVVGTLQRYNPVSNTWATLAPMPTPREHLAAATIDSLIHVVGGRNGANTGKHEAYSPATNTWSTLPDLPTPRGGLAAAEMHGRLYVFGGESPGVFEEVEEYNPKTNSWRTMTPMPQPRHGIGAAVVGDTIFIIGGGPVQGFGVTNVNTGFTLPPPSVGVDDGPGVAGLALLPSRPNPLTLGTFLRFVLPSAGEVTLEIFDIMGHKVATVVTARFDAGAHEARWNAAGVPAGVYFARLEVGDASRSCRLVVLE